MTLRLFCSVMLVSAAVSASDMPLAVSDVVTGPQSHVRLTNNARQPVTAWSLAASSPSPNGGTHREVYTADGYLSEATHGLPGANVLEHEPKAGQVPYVGAEGVGPVSDVITDKRRQNGSVRDAAGPRERDHVVQPASLCGIQPEMIRKPGGDQPGS